jgi:hypothetical protein
MAAKQRDALAHKKDDAIPWPVLADTVDGYVHRMYGCLADPTYLIDTEGRVAFYNTVTHAPTLHRALVALTSRGGTGIVGRGFDRRVHPLPVITAGWPAIRRGLPQSAIESETALPGSAVLPWVGGYMRGVLAPIALRPAPLPRTAKLGLAATAAGVMAFAITRRGLATTNHRSG